MPIQKEFEKYGDEATFIRDFVIPLLRRLGFFIVDYHGKREYGRDLIFSEIDRFNNFVYHGLQAKYEKSISQKESEGLIDDCREAFRHSLQHPITGEVGNICNFVAANAGTFGDNTPENFHEDARNREHRGHVRLLDGKALLHLDRWATVARLEQVAEAISGLLVELRFNRMLLPGVGDAMRQTLQDQHRRIVIERLRTNAVSHYIQRPLLPGSIDTDVISRYLLVAERAVNAPLDVMTAALVTVPVLLANANGILIGIGEIERLGSGLEIAINAVLSTLGPLASS